MAGFVPEAVASFDAARVDALMADAGIVRNRGKIEAAVRSAQAWLEIEAGQGFANYLWGFTDGRPRQNHFRHVAEVPTQTELSVRLSRDLKQRGFNFCGPTIVYAFCQAVGMVNDHLVDCTCHARVSALAAGRGALA